MILSHKKTKAFSFALLFVGLAFLAFFQTFWPWILLVIGVVLGFRSFAYGKIYEAIFNFSTFAILTFTYESPFSWSIVLPIILVIAAIFEVYKAFIDETTLSTQESIEDKQHELEEKE
jgi:hypothetical protein